MQHYFDKAFFLLKGKHSLQKLLFQRIPFTHSWIHFFKKDVITAILHNRIFTTSIIASSQKKFYGAQYSTFVFKFVEKSQNLKSIEMCVNVCRFLLCLPESFFIENALYLYILLVNLKKLFLLL